MDDVDEIPGSVTLQPKSDMSFNMELDSRRKLENEQRHEMAENGYKRTRHPFSGYKQLLNYDLTMPRPKMVKRLGSLNDHTVMDVDTNAPGSVEMTGSGFVYPHPNLPSNTPSNDPKRQINLKEFFKKYKELKFSETKPGDVNKIELGMYKYP